MPQEQFVGPTFFGLRVGFINEAQGVLWSGFEDVQRGAEPAFVGFGEVYLDVGRRAHGTSELLNEECLPGSRRTPDKVVLLAAERAVEPCHDFPSEVLKSMPRLLVEPDVVADDLEPCEVDVVQVQQHGVGQVFFTHSLTSESGPWDARSETITGFSASMQSCQMFYPLFEEMPALPRCLRRHILFGLPSVHDGHSFNYSGGCVCVPSTRD